MPLFDVPGWNLSSPLVAEASTKVSKKRKRPSSDPSKLQSAEVNLEKLVKRLTGNSSTELERTKQAKKSGPLGGSKIADKKRARKSSPTTDVLEEQKKTISRPKPLKPVVIGRDSIESFQPAKRMKTKHKDSTNANDSTAGLTALQLGMKHSLDGARFRMINESLYNVDSRQAHQMMKDDPHVFQDYHAGFRHQVESWPTNPVQHYISALSDYPPKTFVADLGCGDAALARAMIPRGMTILSFDLVSDGVFVIEADICDKIPLPGSEGNVDEKSDGEGQVVDVVICALSLMGTNWPNCLREAWRILKADGELKVAEVASRITDVQEFQSLARSIGFLLKSKDDRNSHFTLFEFQKVPRRRKSDKEWTKIRSLAGVLKPCEYKRR